MTIARPNKAYAYVHYKTQQSLRLWPLHDPVKPMHVETRVVVMVAVG
jgi:uncharacterized membrane protein YfbV (UPF0208 family)